MASLLSNRNAHSKEMNSILSQEKVVLNQDLLIYDGREEVQQLSRQKRQSLGRETTLKTRSRDREAKMSKD